MRFLTILKPQGGGLFFPFPTVGWLKFPWLESLIRAFLNPMLLLHYRKLITSSLLVQIGFLHLSDAPEFTIPAPRAQYRSSHISKFSTKGQLWMNKCLPPPHHHSLCLWCRAPPAAAWSHRGRQTRSWPDSRRYASENLWERCRLLWEAHLSNKYLMDLLISEKALVGEDAPAMRLRENMRQKDAALERKHSDLSAASLVPGSVFLL